MQSINVLRSRIPCERGLRSTILKLDLAVVVGNEIQQRKRLIIIQKSSWCIKCTPEVICRIYPNVFK